MKRLIILIVLFYISFETSAQNLRFSFDVTYGPTSSLVNFYVEYPSDGAPISSEVIFGHTCAVFYNNTSAQPTTWIDATLGWNFDGTISLFNPNLSQIGYNGYVEVQRIDGNVNGTTIIEGQPRTYLGSINFNHLLIPSGNALLAGTNILPAIRYASFSGSGEHNVIITGSSFLPLPIFLHSFSANKLGERSTKLDWRTSSEINSSHFEIQRSTDGLEWTYLGDVAAAGNSTTTRTYDFIDDKLPLGRTKNQIFYYRLRMVDQDGAFKYSDIRGVNFNINDRGDVSIYPNPAAQFFNLDLTGIDFSIDEKATVYIYDMSGKLVRQKDIIGSGIEPINVSELPAEAYNVIIRHGDQQYSKRVIVTK